jgi:hypothetical protein
VLRRSGRSWTAALLAGWMFAFAPFRLMHLNHIQILIAQWIPLTLWFWDRFLAERTPRAAALFLLFYLLHVSGGCYLAYMIHVPLLAVLLVRLRAQGREILALHSLRLLVPVGLVAGVALAMLFLPYVRSGHQLKLSRDVDETSRFAATTASWISPGHRNVYWAGTPLRNALVRRVGPVVAPLFRPENSLFPGFLPSLLGLAGIAHWLRERRRPGVSGGRRLALLALLALALAGWLWGDGLTLTRPEQRASGWEAPALVVLLALGAAYGLRRLWAGPLLAPVNGDRDAWERGIALSGLLCFALAHATFYIPLSRVVPGLDGMRVPARFAAFLSLTIALFAALAIDRLLERLRDRRTRAAVAAGLALLLAVELAPKRVRWVPLLRQEEFPAVYHWLKEQDDVRALVELPIRPNFKETEPMYYSTLHWKPLANGYSGYLPPLHDEITRRMRGVPDREGLAFLRRLGISHLLIHTDAIRAEPERRRLARFERELAAGPSPEAKLVWSAPKTRVYRILPPSSSTPKRAGL